MKEMKEMKKEYLCIGYMIETQFGIITKIDNKFFHTSCYQGVYLFKDIKECKKVRRRFKENFRYYTKIHKVYF